MHNFIKKAAERSGFTREFFHEKNLPSKTSDIYVLPFFGDIKSTCLLSSFFLKKKGYFILCSWPGFAPLFPNVDEYWSCRNVNDLANGMNYFYNESSSQIEVKRALFENFENVMDYSSISTKFQEPITRFLPEIPSLTTVKTDLSKGKILLFPSIRMSSSQKGKTEYFTVSRSVWVHIIERLLEINVTPVLIQNDFTYDLSSHFLDKCLYLKTCDVMQIMTAMRGVKLVLDVHDGSSRLASIARCPFVAVEERKLFNTEFDDLMPNLAKKYIFSAATCFLSGNKLDWDDTIINNIIKEVKLMRGSALPEGRGSIETISYDIVRGSRNKRMGIRFIKKN